MPSRAYLAPYVNEPFCNKSWCDGWTSRAVKSTHLAVVVSLKRRSHRIFDRPSTTGHCFRTRTRDRWLWNAGEEKHEPSQPADHHCPCCAQEQREFFSEVGSEAKWGIWSLHQKKTYGESLLDTRFKSSEGVLNLCREVLLNMQQLRQTRRCGRVYIPPETSSVSSSS